MPKQKGRLIARPVSKMSPPLVSETPPITNCRFLEIKWGEVLRLPVSKISRRRKVEPEEVSLSGLLVRSLILNIAIPGYSVASPLVKLAESVKKQAEAEISRESEIRQELQEFNNRRDKGEISEEEYQKTKEQLRKKLKVLKDKGILEEGV